jgi:hypothetical protein
VKYLLTLLFCASAFGADIGEKSRNVGLVGGWLTPGQFSIFNVFDVSAIRNNGTVTSGTAVFTDNRPAMRFNGNGYVSLATLPALTDFTLSMWVKNGTSANNQCYFSNNYSSTGGIRFFRRRSGLGSALDLAQMNGETLEREVYAPTALPTSTVHVAATYTGGLVTLFVNGMAVTNRTGFSFSFTSSHKPYIGVIQSSTSGFFDHAVGDFSTVKLLNYALKPAEVAALYKEELR